MASLDGSTTDGGTSAMRSDFDVKDVDVDYVVDVDIVAIDA